MRGGGVRAGCHLLAGRGVLSGMQRSAVIASLALSVLCHSGWCPAAVAAGEPAAAAAEPVLRDTAFLEQLAATGRFGLGAPKGARLLPDGSAVLFLRSSGPRSFVQDLWLFDVATGSERALLTAEQLLSGRDEQLSAAELARRERQRMSSRGIAAFDLSKDGRTLVVPLSGDVYLLDLAKARAGDTAARKISSPAGPAIDPRLSPDGMLLCAVRSGTLYVHAVATGTQVAVSPQAAGAVSYGEAEFVAQEEMDRSRGYWWSPDSTRIVYQRTDTEGLPTFYIPDPANPAREPASWPYPQAGGPNARVSLFVSAPLAGAGAAGEKASEKATEITWDVAAFPYLTRVNWPKTGPLTIQVMNRQQTHQQLLAVDPATGRTRLLLEERDPAWLNLPAGDVKWLADGSGFLWLTEQLAAAGGAADGWELQLRGANGAVRRVLVPASVGLNDVVGLDEKNGYVFVSLSAKSYVSRLRAFPLGAAMPQELAATGLPVGSGAAESAAIMEGGSFAEDAPLMLRSVASLDNTVLPRQVVERLTFSRGPGQPVAVGSTVVGELRSIAETPAITARPEIMDLTIPAGGQTGGEPLGIHVAVLRPRDFDPAKRYPALNFAYAGPHSNRVNASHRGYLLEQWYADQGFIVVSTDVRGTPKRGRAWERAIRGNLIEVPLAEQAAAMQALCERIPQIERGRIGVYGWSFGGYFSAMATMRRPDVFAAGVAGAPVADWADYDTFYTERYLGLPSENEAGYKASNVLTYAKDLRVPLLIIHGTADDNVYTVNSLKMTDALFKAGRRFEFLPLANQTHMVTKPEVVRLMHSRIATFFVEQLAKPSK
jgi:dipeptidyl-peptidase-4